MASTRWANAAAAASTSPSQNVIVDSDGSAPPPRTKGGAQKRTCRDIDECEALGEKRTAEQFGEEMPFSTTAEGVRWRDVAEGAGGDAVKRGDAVRFKYRVMRLGKRATDNLSGKAPSPLAQMVDNGACIEDALLPQPANFGAKRRLARRFDEGLLLEVEVLAK
ncbi:hypothetical protein JL721_12574 [Aureococcus anophagefferens]|nr:hypothetical protein JL721_12574 [Aureococcus anophagefferens]